MSKKRFKELAKLAGIRCASGSKQAAQLARAAAEKYPQMLPLIAHTNFQYGRLCGALKRILRAEGVLAESPAKEIKPAPKPFRVAKPKSRRVTAEERAAFYFSQEWRELRYKVLVKYGARCQCCGATPADGVKMHVDHIKPRFHFPELSLAESNLQVLCEPCNLGKRHLDATDWRPQESC